MAAVCLQFFVYNSAAKVDGGRESMVFLGRSLAALQTTTFLFFFRHFTLKKIEKSTSHRRHFERLNVNTQQIVGFSCERSA